MIATILVGGCTQNTAVEKVKSIDQESSVIATGKSTKQEIEQRVIITSITDWRHISSPLIITGKALGNWFFEANTHVTLVNWDGLILAEGPLNTTDNRMTTELISFSGSLSFNIPDNMPYRNGALIIHKANPSGESSLDKTVEINIML